MESSTVTNCLPLAWTSLSVRPSVGRISAGAGHGVRAVDLGGDVDGEAGAAHRGLGDVRVGGGRDEVAAHGEEDLGVAVAQGLDGADDVVAVVARRGDPELRVEGVQEGGGGALEDAHGAVALHVGVAADGADAGAGAADVAAQQQEVDDLADGRHGVLVLGEAHGPADDGALRGEDHGQGLLDGPAVEAGGGEGLCPVGLAGGGGELLVTVGVLPYEGLVDGAVGLQDHLVEEPEEGLVAADPDLEEEVVECGAPDHAERGLRVLEPLQAGLGERIHRDDLRAGRFGLLQGGEHPGVVRAGVLTGDDDQVRPVEVLQGDAALADADGLRQCGAGGLVAHVGAVGEVVGAEFAGEELEQERGLVAGAARGVEERLVGGAERAQLLGDDVEGALPGHRLVPVGALGEVHRLGDPALLAQPVPAAGGEVGDGVRGEEVGGDPAQRRLLGDGLGAVLAEFRGVPLVALGPGAAGAVEAVLLVDLEEGLRGAPHAHLLLGHEQAVGDGGQPGGGVLGRLDLRRVLDRVTRGRFGGHCVLPFEPAADLGGVLCASVLSVFLFRSCHVARAGRAESRVGRDCQWSVAGSGAWLRRHRRRRQTTDRACS